MPSKEGGHLRKRCYLDVAIGDGPAGRIVIECYDDIVPRTAENFRGICTAEYGMGQSTGKKLSYVGVLFHRVIPGFMIQAGDFSAFDGTGGESIYGGKFADENFQVKHDRPYLVSMANAGKNMNGSQFFITCVPCPTLDGKHVIFGHVIAGIEVVQAIEQTKTDANDRPLVPVKIVKSGELVPVFPQGKASSKSKKKKRAKSISSSSSDSVVDLEQKREKKVKKKAAKLEKKRIKEEEELKAAQPQAYCTIRPEEIPDIPQNKFLERRSSPRPVVLSVAADTTNPKLDASTVVTSAGVRSEKDNRNTSYIRPARRDCDGIAIKGRGAVRYSRRSATPPHWQSRPVNLSFRPPPHHTANDQTRKPPGNGESKKEVGDSESQSRRNGSARKSRSPGEGRRRSHSREVDRKYRSQKKFSSSPDEPVSRQRDAKRSVSPSANEQNASKSPDTGSRSRGLTKADAGHAKEKRHSLSRERKNGSMERSLSRNRNEKSGRHHHYHHHSKRRDRSGSGSEGGGKKPSVSRDRKRRSRS
ncbi:Peptidyl-prolyl cis-trans isomerase G [Hypsibius exemplaris]|uniref:peptidylprolyl isomerase n=1 Tax=Hypsibius exemplaris TaxID=2072580 RepID=A0A1W0XBA8_HYPEX|nr:Peptidyl-prolyl cis-trans isomerase G [Hypsibius exemplaris]